MVRYGLDFNRYICFMSNERHLFGLIYTTSFFQVWFNKKKESTESSNNISDKH